MKNRIVFLTLILIGLVSYQAYSQLDFLQKIELNVRQLEAILLQSNIGLSPTRPLVFNCHHLFLGVYHGKIQSAFFLN
jgi:hypothetical protein